MQAADIRKLYDDGYAATYEGKFLLSAATKVDAAFEAWLIGTLLTSRSEWLDVACGTGFFLRGFPHVRRTGLDLSPAMLRLARAKDPDVELLEHDFRVPIPEWADRFGLVSLMWYAYGLVDTIAELAQVVANLAEWTSPDGACFVPLADPKLIAGVDLPYAKRDDDWAGAVRVTGVIWSYSEDDGAKQHLHQLAPHVDFMVELFQRHFSSVKLVRYPPAQPGWTGRPAIIARDKTVSASGRDGPDPR